MLMVIVLHTMLNFTIRPDFFPSKLWFVFEPIVAVSKTCVLLFFMLSGYLVIIKQRTLRVNLRQTVKKIIWPLAFFSMMNVVYAWALLVHNESSRHQFVAAQLQKLTTFPSSPLWFLIVLAFLYLLNPVWHTLFAKQQTGKRGRAVVGGSLLFSILITIVAFPLGQVGTIFNNYTAWTGFVFFYLYGALARQQWVTTQHRLSNLCLFVGGLLLTIGGDYLSMWLQIQQISFAFTNYSGQYLSIPVVMMAVGLFNLLIQVDLSQLPNKLINAIIKVSQLSFGIYLLHPYVIGFFTDFVGFDFNKLQINVYAYNLLNIALILIISAAATMLIQQIPKLRTVIGT